MGIFSKNKKEPVVIGGWDSDIIETRNTGKTHYQVQTLDGLKQLLNRIESEGGIGNAKLGWWVSGLHFDLSATIPMDVLMALKNEVKADEIESGSEGQHGVIQEA
jgi:hypothetical protein